MNGKTFFVLLTSQCNMCCPHCYNMLDSAKQKKMEKDLLSVEQLQVIFDKLVIKGFSKVMFSGGEALLHPYIMQIIFEAKKRNLITALFTNGKELNPIIIKKFEASGLDEIRISFNELVWIQSRQQYELIYNNQTRYIEELKNAKMRVGFIYVISKNNVDYVVETYKRLLESGVTMKIQPLYLPKTDIHYNDTSAAVIQPHKWVELMEQFTVLGLRISKNKEENDNKVYGGLEEILQYLELLVKVFTEKEKPNYCPTGPVLVIDAQGYFHPCLFRHDIVCGSIRNTIDVEMIAEQLNDYLYFQEGECYCEECLSAYR